MAFTAGMVESMGIDGIHYMGGALNETTSRTTTFSSVNLGPENSGREIFLAFISYHSTTGGATSATVTVGGVSVTEKSHTSTFGGLATLARIVVPTGTSADIVYTTPAGSDPFTSCTMFVYRAVRKTSGTNSDSQSYNGANTDSTYETNTVTIPAGGIIIGVGKISPGSGGGSTTNVTVTGTDVVKAGEFDTTIDVPMTNYSWYIDGTNYTSSTIPIVSHSWVATQFHLHLDIAW